jgi:four helix bundle protein
MKTMSFKDLIVWQKSYKLVLEIYKITKEFPKTETYGLSQQMRKAAVSIPSNIAEGYGRKHKAEYTQFLSIAYGSLLEIETQYMLAIDLKYVSTKS